LAVAEQLTRRGHEVVVLSQPSVRDRAERAGARFRAFTATPNYEPRTALEDQLAVAFPVITGRSVGNDIIAATGDHGCDVLLVDANLGGGLAAAEVLPEPSVVLLHSMYRTFTDTWFGEFWPLLAPALTDTRRSYGLPLVDGWPGVFAAHDRIWSVVPSRFDAPIDAVPSSMRYFGFLVPETPTVANGASSSLTCDAQLVVVGLSTTYQRQGALLQRILDALGSISVRGLVSTCGQVDIDSLRAPPNLSVTEFVDHRQVLQRADVMVTHAGLGSDAAALSAGVPLVCLPIGRDQPLNAQRVEECGAGIALDVDANPATIAASIERVLSQPAYRTEARSLAEASIHEGGAVAAAAELENLAR
jgi:UDP:flavonoid glycosyltransferase YjiC (YdhE family)